MHATTLGFLSYWGSCNLKGSKTTSNTKPYFLYRFKTKEPLPVSLLWLLFLQWSTITCCILNFSRASTLNEICPFVLSRHHKNTFLVKYLLCMVGYFWSHHKNTTFYLLLSTLLTTLLCPFEQKRNLLSSLGCTVS